MPSHGRGERKSIRDHLLIRPQSYQITVLLMTSFNLKFSLKILSLDTVTLGIGASAHEFGTRGHHLVHGSA